MAEKSKISDFDLSSWLKFNQPNLFTSINIRIPMDNADKKCLLKEMIFYRRYEERTFEADMECKIGGFLHLYSGQEAVATGV